MPIDRSCDAAYLRALKIGQRSAELVLINFLRQRDIPHAPDVPLSHAGEHMRPSRSGRHTIVQLIELASLSALEMAMRERGQDCPSLWIGPGS